MTLEIVNDGQNNQITVQPCPLIQGRLTLRGNNNNVALGTTIHPGNLNIMMHSDGNVLIGDNYGLGDIRIYIMSSHCVLKVGDTFLVNGSTQITMHEPSKFTVGSDCLIAPGTSFQTSDIHSIFDLSTGTRSNPSKDIMMGDHVWIGAEAVVLKGAHIGNGSIIARNSVVTGVIPSCSLAGGIPAKIIRSNVTWHHQLLDTMPSDLNDLATTWIKSNI